MNDEIVAITFLIAFFGSIAFITRVISDNRVKRELVNMRTDRDTIEYLLSQAPASQHESSFKWGLVAVALGAAFGLIHLLDLDGNDAMTYAIMFVAGGGGLLVHYAMKARAGK